MVLVALVGAVAAQAVGLEGVLGAFVAGVVLGRSKFQHSEAFGVIEAMTLSLFAPIFFARAGLRVDLGALTEPSILFWGGAVLAAASASKFIGAFAGARFAGLARREGLALGAGLNARGALEIVVASVGLSLGVLNESSYTVVVLMAIATSMMAPIMLRAVARNWQGSAAERERLDRERVLSRNTLVRPERLLLPSHGGANSILAARLLDLAWPEGVEATVLSIGNDVSRERIAMVCEAFTARPVEHEHVENAPPLAAILAHAKLGYGAIGVGATDRAVANSLISPVVDELLASSPLPVIMVRRAARGAGEIRHILVPAVGTVAGDAALEVAFSMARRVDAAVTVAHVVTAPRSEVARSMLPWRRTRSDEPTNGGRVAVAGRMLDDARKLAEDMGVRVTTHVRSGSSASEELLALARETRPDLLVVTASVRQLSDRPFLGHGVEHLLERCESTLVVVATPPGWAGSTR
jgi:nucleotide-binding universal stress UspA family protein